MRELLNNPWILVFVVFNVLSGLADIIQVAWGVSEYRKKRDEEMKKRHVSEFLYEQAKGKQ